MDRLGFTRFLPPRGGADFPGHGLYYKQFTKEGFPKHAEAFLRGILEHSRQVDYTNCIPKISHPCVSASEVGRNVKNF
jgi:hypothetical protein